jgi:hypothetical protein
MTDDPNIFEIAAWEREYGPVRGSRLGPAAGASDLGCTLFERRSARDVEHDRDGEARHGTGP